MSNEVTPEKTPNPTKPEAEAGGMTPLGINIIACASCGHLKTATGATIADLHRLSEKPKTGPAQGNPAGMWARIVIPVYVCLDCSVELSLNDAECARMVVASKGESDGQAE